MKREMGEEEEEETKKKRKRGEQRMSTKGERENKK